jgi:oligoribonuclease NrnB/cAMP/cGMP phosphodiesterase (DHH superfamily)
MPTIVKMLGRYDVWDFSEYGSIPLNALQVGIKLWDHHPKSANWKGWLASNTKVEEISTQGEAILRFRESTYAGYIQNFAFHTTFENYKAVCCNAPEFRNQLFDSVDPTTYDIMVPFSFNGKTWKVSLYTTNPAIDVSEIAKKYGGGGHKQAAGFVCKELPKGLSHKIRVEGK